MLLWIVDQPGQLGLYRRQSLLLDNGKILPGQALFDFSQSGPRLNQLSISLFGFGNLLPDNAELTLDGGFLLI